MTQKRTSTSTTSISVWKICELKQYFRKLNIKCCRRLLKLQNIYSMFFLNMFRFLNKLSLFGVSDVTKLLATWHSTTAQPRKCSCSWLKSSKSTSNVTNYYSQPQNDDKTTFFIFALFRVSRKPVFGRNFLESNLAENFTIYVAHVLGPILKFSDLFLIWFMRYLLITFWLIN